MTQAERLIKNLCESKRLQILEAERTAKQTAPRDVPWKAVPAIVRAHLLEYRTAVKRVEALKKKITKAGFQYYPVRPGRRVNLYDPSRLRDGVTHAADVKRTRLKAVQTAATIASMGQPPEKQRIVLEELQKALTRL